MDSGVARDFQRGGGGGPQLHQCTWNIILFKLGVGYIGTIHRTQIFESWSAKSYPPKKKTLHNINLQLTSNPPPPQKKIKKELKGPRSHLKKKNQTYCLCTPNNNFLGLSKIQGVPPDIAPENIVRYTAPPQHPPAPRGLDLPIDRSSRP